MIQPTNLRYSVEVQNQRDARKWESVAFRLTIEGARYKLLVERRDDPLRAFRILDRLTDQVSRD